MVPRKWAGLLAHGHRTLRLPMPVGTVAYAGRSHSQWRDRVGFSPNFPIMISEEITCTLVFIFHLHLLYSVKYYFPLFL